MDVGGLALAHSMCFLNQSKMSPFFIISRHALSQLANHYGEAGGALIQDNNTPWALGATVLLRAFRQHRTVLRKPNWVVELEGGRRGRLKKDHAKEKLLNLELLCRLFIEGMRGTSAHLNETKPEIIVFNALHISCI